MCERIYTCTYHRYTERGDEKTWPGGQLLTPSNNSSSARSMVLCVLLSASPITPYNSPQTSPFIISNTRYLVTLSTHFIISILVYHHISNISMVPLLAFSVLYISHLYGVIPRARKHIYTDLRISSSILLNYLMKQNVHSGKNVF